MERHASIGHRIVLPIHGPPPDDARAACATTTSAGTAAATRTASPATRSRSARASSSSSTCGTRSRPTAPTSTAFAQAQVRDILAKSRGTHFEPALVDLFLEILDEDGDEMLALTGGAGA